MEIGKKDYLNVKEAKEFLEKNGIPWTEVWIRQQISNKRIKSEKIYSSRLIPREEIIRIIKEKKQFA